MRNITCLAPRRYATIFQASCLAIALAGASHAGAAQDGSDLHYSFEWVACEQSEVDHAPSGVCQLRRGSSQPKLVLFISPAARDEQLEGLPGFRATASERAGIDFHIAGGGGTERSLEQAQSTRSRFLALMEEMYGSRLHIIEIAPDTAKGIPSVGDRLQTQPDTRPWSAYNLAEEPDGAPVGVRFLASAFADLDISTATLISMLRANLQLMLMRQLSGHPAEFRFSQVRTGNYLVRVGQLFPRFNRSMDFAMLRDDLSDEGVRAPINAEPGDAQYLQVAFLRHFLNAEPEARGAMADYLAALEELDTLIETLSLAEPDGASVREGIRALPQKIDAFEQGFARLRPLLDRQFDGDNLGELTAALRARTQEIEAELAEKL